MHVILAAPSELPSVVIPHTAHEETESKRILCAQGHITSKQQGQVQIEGCNQYLGPKQS